MMNQGRYLTETQKKLKKRDISGCGYKRFLVSVFANEKAGVEMGYRWQRKCDCFEKVVSTFPFFCFRTDDVAGKGIDYGEMDISETGLLARDVLSLCQYLTLPLADRTYN